MTVARAFAGRIGVVHLRDQKGETPVPFGKGDLPFSDLLALLKESDFNGPLVIELENVTWAKSLEAAKTARAFVENLLG